MSSVSSAYRVHDHETHRSVSAGSLPGDFAGHAAGWARRIKDKIRWLSFILSYAGAGGLQRFPLFPPWPASKRAAWRAAATMAQRRWSSGLVGTRNRKAAPCDCGGGVFPADNTPTLAVLPLSEQQQQRRPHRLRWNPEKAKERRGESAVESRTKVQLSREAGGADENLEKAKERRGESAEPRAKAQMSRDPGGGVGARREARRGLGARRGGRAGGPRTNSCSRSGIAHLVVGASLAQDGRVGGTLQRTIVGLHGGWHCSGR